MIFLIILLLQLNISAQNLVPNSNFEDNNGFGTTTIANVQHWYSPNDGTPDYFFFINSNIGQYPHSGVAFVAIGTYNGPSYFNSREYIQIKLNSQLEINKKYIVTFYLSLKNSARYSTNNIGCYISKTAITTSNYNLLNYTPQINTPIIIKDTVNWVEISEIINSDGGEEYLTIGNFYSDSNTNIDSITSNNSYFASLYYIDDVSVILCDTCDVKKVTNNLFIPDAFSPNGDGVNDKLYFRGVNTKELYFAVYDRWGEKVFETTDKTIGWDGSYKGKQLSNNVFVYYCYGKYDDGSEFKQKGDVLLVR